DHTGGVGAELQRVVIVGDDEGDAGRTDRARGGRDVRPWLVGRRGEGRGGILAGDEDFLREGGGAGFERDALPRGVGKHDHRDNGRERPAHVETTADGPHSVVELLRVRGGAVPGVRVQVFGVPRGRRAAVGGARLLDL